MVGKLLLPRRLSKGSIVTGVIVPLRSMQESAIAKREHHAVLQTYDPAAQSGLVPTTQELTGVRQRRGDSPNHQNITHVSSWAQAKGP